MSDKPNPTPVNPTGLPIREDSSIEVGEIPGHPGEFEIVSVKPIFRPPEKISDPIKPYWIWIWIVVVVVVVVAWAFLFWYFSNHQAPYAAPLR